MTRAELIIRLQEMHEIPVHECAGCGVGIFDDEIYYDIFGEDYCEECVREMRHTASAGDGLD